MQLIPAALAPHVRRFGFSGLLAAGVVVVMLLGINPITVLTGQVSPPPPPTSITGRPAVDAAPETVAAYPAVVGGEAELMWRRAFRLARLYFPEVALAVVATRSDFGCAMSGKDMTVFYCPETATVFVDTAAYERLRAAQPDGADYAMAHLVAEAYGRHVQSTLHVFETLAELSPAERPVAEQRADLQSTCYAAMWASSAMIEGLFDDPNVLAAIALVEANRDRSILTPEDRRVVPEAFERGSAEARKVWYGKGYAIPAGGTCALAKIEAAGLL